MSYKVTGPIWDSKLHHEKKFVLICLGDIANEYGENIYPAVGTIAARCSYSERNVQRILKQLKADGLLVADSHGKGGRAENGKSGRTVYHIDMAIVSRLETWQRPSQVSDSEKNDKLSPLENDKLSPLTVQSTTSKGDISDTSHIVDRARVLTVLEPSLEPSNTLFDSDESVTQPSKEPVKDPPKPNPVAIYCDAFRGRYGQDPVISRKDAGIISQLYKSLSPKNYSAALAGYFATNDPFILTNVHEPGMLASKVNRWIMEGKSADIVNVQAEDSEDESHTGGFDYVSPNHKYDYSGANTDHAG